MNIYFHTLALDGVFTTSAPDTLQFHPTLPPTDAEVAAALLMAKASCFRSSRMTCAANRSAGPATIRGNAEEDDACVLVSEMEKVHARAGGHRARRLPARPGRATLDRVLTTLRLGVRGPGP